MKPEVKGMVVFIENFIRKTAGIRKGYISIW